jgi:hypothetical protein
MRYTTLIAVAGVITLSLGQSQAGDVYKYVDERGNTLYTDRPMPGATKVLSSSARPPEVTARINDSQQAAANQQLAASNQRIAQQQTDARLAATVARDLEATRMERCKKARADYDRVIASRRVYKEDKDGKRTYLSDAEISQQRLEAARTVEAICGPQG